LSDTSDQAPPQLIPALLNEAFFIVVPHRVGEPFSLVALRPMQMAHPVVVSRVDGLAEVLKQAMCKTRRMLRPGPIG